jgi:hypothetical protein
MVERNVFQLAQRLRYYGKGYNLTRKSWDRYPNSFWTVTKIKFKEVRSFCRLINLNQSLGPTVPPPTPSPLAQNSVDHGKAYGVLTWRGIFIS